MIGVLVIVVSFISITQGLHDERVPLRGYECKQNAQRPCRLCEPGFYCPNESTKLACGKVDMFCSLGSVLPVPVTDGYYTTTGDKEHRSDQKICEPGFICITGEKLVCPLGHYCPHAGMTIPLECGDSSKFCKEGSIQPKEVKSGYYTAGGTNTTRTEEKPSPQGHYAKNGILMECNEGHYGDIEGLSNDSCSGLCEAGWYCPAASISSRQRACGGEDYFCPEGSSFPQKVKTGHYTSNDWDPCRPGMYQAKPKYSEITNLSPVGDYRDDSHCVLCPEGTFKAISGNDKDSCIECGPMAKSSSDRITCECYQSATEKLLKRMYFDVGEKKCHKLENLMALPDVQYSQDSQLTKSREKKCDPGSYCIGGVRYLCPAGRYGDKDAEINSDCSGPCEAGYWCPPGSKSPRESKCGVKPNVYCPESSAKPIYIDEGYYGNEGDPSETKTSQELCPPGFYCPGDGLRHPCLGGYYGRNTGLISATCDGICSAGYYCPEASTSQYQNPCGNASVFCPKGSSVPLFVIGGYYTASDKSILTHDMSFAGPNSTHDVSLQCEVGYYCKGGIKYQCPSGKYGAYEGADDVSDCYLCLAGYYCQSYPGVPTTDKTMRPCGQSYLYCPQGSSKPKIIDVGHYGIHDSLRMGVKNDESEETMFLRTDQVMCPPGYYCQQGLRFKCKPGTYGEKSGLFDEKCSGLCPRGYFCPENTVHPLPCSPGAYSTGGASECTSCQVPLTVSMEKKNRMCRNDRSCCFAFYQDL